MHAWTTSWGVSTRLVGGLIMTHGDDDGVVLPPRLAPQQVVILPIYKDSTSQRTAVMSACDALKRELTDARYADEPLRVEIDDRDLRGGEKNWHHVKRGVPIRVEIGPRDLDAGVVSVARRDQPPRERQSLPRERFAAEAPAVLGQIQDGLLERARAFREAHTEQVEDLGSLQGYFEDEAHSGFAIAPMAAEAEEDPAFQELLKRMKITPRCIIGSAGDNGASSSAARTCAFTGARGAADVVFARAY